MIKLYKHNWSLFLSVQILGVYIKHECDSNRNVHCEGINNFARSLIFRNCSSVSYKTDDTNLAFALFSAFMIFNVWTLKKMQNRDLKTYYRCIDVTENVLNLPNFK